jgi:hypothetical protein
MATTTVRRPAATSNAWAVLADSDSDSDAVGPVTAPVAVQKKPSTARRVSFATLPEPHQKRDVGRAVSPVRRVSVGPTATDTECFGVPLENEWAGRDFTPVLEAMLRGDTSVLWGDLVPVSTTVVDAAPFVSVRRANTAEDFWSQPWAANLTELWSDAYETTRLSEEEWEAMMGWLYEAGWFIRAWDRSGVECEPDNEPARTWISPRILEELAVADAAAPRRGYGHHHKCSAHRHHEPKVATAASKAPKTVVVIPRFCRAGVACAETGCRYTHGDTIPVQNKPCAFDGRCCGEKRATCIYLHPSEGEIWSETLVRHRPTATVL